MTERSNAPHSELIAKLKHVLAAIEEQAADGRYPRLLLVEHGGDGVMQIFDAIHALEYWLVAATPNRTYEEGVKAAAEVAREWSDDYVQEDCAPCQVDTRIAERLLAAGGEQR